jgi:hypothetical protein
MAINMTFFPTEATGTVWFEDGSSQSLDPQQENSLQLPDGDICTVASNAGSAEDDEHMSPEDKALAFAERMLATWQRLFEKARAEVRKPTATPL